MAQKLVEKSRAAPVAQTSRHEERKRRTFPKTTSKQRRILFAINDRRMYGLEIQALIKECTGGREEISISSLYPLLHSLEKRELVQSEWGDEALCGARRRYYRLTELGRALLDREIADYNDLLQGRYSR
ncbi:MAG: PadR family transcriptional regulator [Spirulinaceae cyanobacterium]